ncbi:unnamed protein product [Callosobruchus maculatus]|uniref:apyrase n=1 Tax=Callosobruchus maculatus TaxID=64391 RepID=A0A653DNR6_CALMS|nr:unnamed protein product [Callosobruchus maculatus]
MIFMPGGFSRLYAQIMKMLEEKPNSVLLNAGDDFQGTMYYSIGKWNITQQFMNKLPFDAQVLGNHEFDDGIDGVVPYIKALKHPVIVSNIDDSLEPKMQGIYSKSTVIERNGKKIGIVGVIVEDCDEISNTGKLRFLPESASVNAEAERLVEEEGVFTVIVLSHSGYDHDRLMAKNASDKISLIVGGHSHTFLYTGDNPPGPETPKGPYPTIVQKPNGHNVLVTQASAFSKYLGNVTVYLDKNGEIADFVGAPIFLSPELPQDEKINKDLEPWKRMIDAQGSKIIGSTLVTLDKSACYHAECTLGNFMADAMVFAYTKKSNEYSWTQGAIAMTNSGGGRTTIEVGTPFGNTIDIGNMKGIHVKALLERNMFPYTYYGYASGVKIMQYSGKLRFLPESASVNAEAERLVEEEGVFTVIVLSHSGYDHDRLMAKNASDKIQPYCGRSLPYLFIYRRFEQTDMTGAACKLGNVCIGGFSRLYAQIMKILEEKPSNHEFDDGIDGVVPYIKALKHPVIVSNIDDSLEPTIQGIYSKSTVIERNGKKIGIVGVIVEHCGEISNTGKLRFLPESASVNAEAERLVEEEGVFTVIVLSHSGYDHDRLMAKNASDKISLIITLLGPKHLKDRIQQLFKNQMATTCLLLKPQRLANIWEMSQCIWVKMEKLLILSVHQYFLVRIFLKDLEPWKRMIYAQGSKIIGSTLVTLDMSACHYAECTLGNFMTDAMVYAHSWTQGAIAVTNAGSGRTTIEVGNITLNDMITSAPFGNTIDIGNMKGKHVKALLERNMFPYTYNGNANGVKLMQYSGVQIVFDMSRPVGDRVVSAKLRCQNCTIPIYEDLDEDRTYRIIHPSFLGKGRDGFTEFRDYMTDVQIGPLDIDVFTDYLAHRSPVFEEIEGRTYIRRRDLIVDRNSLIEE